MLIHPKVDRKESRVASSINSKSLIQTYYAVFLYYPLGRVDAVTIGSATFWRSFICLHLHFHHLERGGDQR